MANEKIRQIITKKRLRHYEVAAALGISEYTLSRWLRSDLNSERKQRVLKAIDRASKNLG